MKVTLMFPRNAEDGLYLEAICHFAARRARTLRRHDELIDEVSGAGIQGREHFLHHILQSEWSLDVAEMSLFVYDVEGVPSWLMTEFLRHRLIARDWSFEQRSKRAIGAHRIPVINPFDPNLEPAHYQQMEDLVAHSHTAMSLWRADGVAPEKIRYGALEGSDTAFVVASNARALHHLFTLRGSKALGGNGTAAPEFWAVVADMHQQARQVCPNLFAQVLRS